VPQRMKKLTRDPLAEVLDRVPDLAAALGRLTELVARER
jgi:hypothetical protein